MENITDEFAAALREAYSDLPDHKKGPVEQWIEGELLMGFRPMVNDHSGLVLFIEYEPLTGGKLIDIAEGLYHKGKPLVLPILFGESTLQDPRPVIVSRCISEFREVAINELHLTDNCLVLHSSLATIPLGMMLSFISGQIPVIPQSLRAASDASHQIFHAENSFGPHSEHRNDPGDPQTIVEKWLNSLGFGEKP